MPYSGYCGTIIDFSDSVINQTFLNNVNNYVSYDSFENIIDREKENILSKLLKYQYVKRKKIKYKLPLYQNIMICLKR